MNEQEKKAARGMTMEDRRALVAKVDDYVAKHPKANQQTACRDLKLSYHMYHYHKQLLKGAQVRNQLQQAGDRAALQTSKIVDIAVSEPKVGRKLKKYLDSIPDDRVKVTPIPAEALEAPARVLVVETTVAGAIEMIRRTLYEPA